MLHRTSDRNTRLDVCAKTQTPGIAPFTTIIIQSLFQTLESNLRFNLHSRGGIRTAGCHANTIRTDFTRGRLPLEKRETTRKYLRAEIRNCCVVIAGSALPLPARVMRNKFERDKCKQHTAESSRKFGLRLFFFYLLVPTRSGTTISPVECYL